MSDLGVPITGLEEKAGLEEKTDPTMGRSLLLDAEGFEIVPFSGGGSPIRTRASRLDS
jgi:hypothetical protein